MGIAISAYALYSSIIGFSIVKLSRYLYDKFLMRMVEEIKGSKVDNADVEDLQTNDDGEIPSGLNRIEKATIFLWLISITGYLLKKSYYAVKDRIPVNQEDNADNSGTNPEKVG